MADNDIEIEELIDDIRGHEPSQIEEPATFISVEEIMAGPSMAAPSPLLFGIPGPGYSYQPDDPPVLVSGLITPDWQASNNLTLQAANGPSVELTPTGTININDGHGHVTHINLVEQAFTIARLQQQVDSLSQLVSLLGTALNAQIDNEVMAGLSPEERTELRRVVAERNTNQQMRQQALNFPATSRPPRSRT